MSNKPLRKIQSTPKCNCQDMLFYSALCQCKSATSDSVLQTIMWSCLLWNVIRGFTHIFANTGELQILYHIYPSAPKL